VFALAAQLLSLALRKAGSHKKENNMPTTDDMRWFKTNFQDKINAAIAGTPFTLDLMTALACQETGDVWPILRHKDLSLDRILELCVGDTIDFHPEDGSGRHAFPRNKAALLEADRGREMFELAHQALVDISKFIPGFAMIASKPNKFCHGYGIFQFDLQFFKEEPDYFLNKDYANFDKCLQKALDELRDAQSKIPELKNKSALSDVEQVHVAIAYNTGGFDPARGLKQGFRPKDKKGHPTGLFYGEQVFEFLKTAKTVTTDDGAVTTTSTPGAATGATGATFKVTAPGLNLRSDPSIPPNDSKANVQVTLPNGQSVRALTDQIVNGFREVETDFQGQHLRGFCSAQFLTQVSGATG
jgi:hypothetical protein